VLAGVARLRMAHVDVWTTSYGESPRQIEGPHLAASSVTRRGNLPIFLRMERKPQQLGVWMSGGRSSASGAQAVGDDSTTRCTPQRWRPRAIWLRSPYGHHWRPHLRRTSNLRTRT
jgi:hypothetical protein